MSVLWGPLRDSKVTDLHSRIRLPEDRLECLHDYENEYVETGIDWKLSDIPVSFTIGRVVDGD